MKKLKKLTRKGLEELSKDMPMLNEIQQRSLIGGNIYFGLENGLYVFDPAQEFGIVVDTTNDYVRFVGTPAENYLVEESFYQNSSESAKSTVLRGYCSNYINNASGVNIQFSSSCYDIVMNITNDGIVHLEVPDHEVYTGQQLIHNGMLAMMQSGQQLLATM